MTIPAPRYQIPTHLNVPDKIDIPLLGITISLTMRQGAIFLFGWSTAFAWWRGTIPWQTLGVLPMLLHWGLPSLLALLVFFIAMLQVQGRSYEQWALIIGHYLVSEKVFVWHSVAAEHLQGQAQKQESSYETQGREREETDRVALREPDHEKREGEQS
jgi:hypothetical protein